MKNNIFKTLLITLLGYCVFNLIFTIYISVIRLILNILPTSLSGFVSKFLLILIFIPGVYLSYCIAVSVFDKFLHPSSMLLASRIMCIAIAIVSFLGVISSSNSFFVFMYQLVRLVAVCIYFLRLLRIRID